MYMSPQATILKDADPALWGFICTPLRWSKIIPSGFRWLADNGCFTDAWNETAWLEWLDSLMPYRTQCIMATLPDVVGDAATTLERFAYYLPMIRERGWPIGLVAQDGLESLPWPQDYDALFVGGSTEWKLSGAADWCIKRAKAAGKWTHVGRVNSAKRIKHFKLIEVDSVDGTHICFKPTARFNELKNWMAWRPLLQLD